MQPRPRLVLRRRRASRPGTCAYCRADVAATERWACAACGALQHPECATELGRCPTLGCGRRQAPRAVAPPASPRRWSDRLPAVALLLTVWAWLVIGALWRVTDPWSAMDGTASGYSSANAMNLVRATYLLPAVRPLLLWTLLGLPAVWGLARAAGAADPRS